MVVWFHNYNKKVNKLPHSIIFNSHFYIVAGPSKKWIETRAIKNMHIYREGYQNQISTQIRLGWYCHV